MTVTKLVPRRSLFANSWTRTSLARGIQSTSIGHWGFPGIGSWTPPLLHIHYITGSHHTGTWFLLPFLCWWHTALSLISTRWSNGGCTDLRLLDRHLCMDERTSPTAQPGKDWASCLPCHSNSTAWLHDSVRFINNYPISFGQKSWCNLWWPADLQTVHCKDCSIYIRVFYRKCNRLIE